MSDFVYGNTRLHARRAALLDAADYEQLLGEDIDALLAALEQTSYAPELERFRDQTGLRRLHKTIRAHLGRSLEEMRGFYADRARELVDLMLSRFDVENVVLMLRARAGTSARPTRRSVRSCRWAGWSSRWPARSFAGPNSRARST